jgi:hypothetical protein
MRLLNTTTYEIEEFIGSNIPPYAILSHTWEQDEVVLQEYQSPTVATRDKQGYKKIIATCDLARESDGLGYAWVDTCCIDKTSSSELSEAINSMFRWYKDAVVCYAYLQDLKPEQDVASMCECRWFTRGWTLQELIAPQRVLFYDSGWSKRGDKQTLRDMLRQITNINGAVLSSGYLLASFPIATRMFWASRRKTTRLEDRAYCLMGLFNVNMPLLYGEGEKAFLRLQHEIMKVDSDLTILAWGPHEDMSVINDQLITELSKRTNDFIRCRLRDEKHNAKRLLAESPSAFSSSFSAPVVPYKAELSITSMGIRLRTNLDIYCGNWTCTWGKCVCARGRRHFLTLAEGFITLGRKELYGLELRQFGMDLFARTSPGVVCIHDDQLYFDTASQLTTDVRLQVDPDTMQAFPGGRMGSKPPFRTFTANVKSLTNVSPLQILTSEAVVRRAYPSNRFDRTTNEWFQVNVPESLRWGCVDASLECLGEPLIFGVFFCYNDNSNVPSGRLFRGRGIGAKDRFTLSQLTRTEPGSFATSAWAEEYFAQSLNPLRLQAPEQRVSDWSDFELQGKPLRVLVGAPNRTSLCMWIEER